MAQKNKEKGMKNEVQALDESMLDNVSGGASSLHATYSGNDPLKVEWSADTQEEFEELSSKIFDL